MAETSTIWLTPSEAARILGVSRDTVTKWANDGRLPSSRTVGQHRRFRREDVDALLDQERAS